MTESPLRTCPDCAGTVRNLGAATNPWWECEGCGRVRREA